MVSARNFTSGPRMSRMWSKRGPRFSSVNTVSVSVFKRVLLVSAAGDRYVSPHSARIDTPKSAFLDKVAGPSNILLTETLQKKLEVNKPKDNLANKTQEIYLLS